MGGQGGSGMPQTITGFFNNIEAAQRAAYGLGVRCGSVRAQVYSARTADSGHPELSLPLADLAVLNKGVQPGVVGRSGPRCLMMPSKMQRTRSSLAVPFASRHLRRSSLSMA